MFISLNRKRGLGLILGLAAVCGARADIIYQNNFESGLAAEFSNSPITTAPNASTKFLGEFAGTGAPSGTTLGLSGIFAHETVTIALDLYIIHSWDGNATSSGPDRLTFTADGTPLLDATFSNWDPSQSYSDATPLGGGPFAGKTDADAENTLGYGSFFGTNTTYHLEFTFAHQASTLSVVFQGIGIQDVGDESWGIDNLVVSATPVPEPCTLLLVGAGLAALRKRRVD